MLLMATLTFAKGYMYMYCAGMVSVPMRHMGGRGGSTWRISGE